MSGVGIDIGDGDSYEGSTRLISGVLLGVNNGCWCVDGSVGMYAVIASILIFRKPVVLV